MEDLFHAKHDKQYSVIFYSSYTIYFVWKSQSMGHSCSRGKKDSELYISCSTPDPLNYGGGANCESTVPNKTACADIIVDGKDISRYLPGLFKCSSARDQQRHSISHLMTCILSYFKIYYKQVLKHVSLTFSFWERSCEHESSTWMFVENEGKRKRRTWIFMEIDCGVHPILLE